ncbi:MAG: DEAD/DEAH box helicase [Candidatus Schekmanbacteria bacterium]|nr:DEAD/DEAH box helicase [Candidatus Schekmanbacteria bacterium]
MNSPGGLDTASRDAAVRILMQRLTSRDVRAVFDAEMGSTRRKKSVEWIVAETEHAGGRLRSRLSDDDLATLLVDLMGPDLLSLKELRHRLALGASSDELDRLHDYPSQCVGRGGRPSQAKAIADRPWHPGKTWPAHFVRIHGFPDLFGGIAGSPTDPDSIDVEPFRPLPSLEDFQVDLKGQLLEVMNARPGDNRGILSLPTGAGKTRTAVEGLVEWRLSGPGRPGVLWIAQSDELCEQAVQAFREVWIDQGHRPAASREPLTIHRLWGGGRAVAAHPDVVVASIQKLHAIIRAEDGSDGARDERQRALALMAEHVGVVIVDEAHRVLAPSYAEVLRFLGAEIGRSGRSAVPLVGLTATPYRGVEEETRRLANRFHGRLLRPSGLGEDPVSCLRERGVLSRPVHTVVRHDGPLHVLDSDTRFQDYFERFSDFHPEFLQQLGQECVRNQRLINILCELPPKHPTLFFGCSVEHARAIAVLLRRRGRSAATVVAGTRSATRRFLIEEFRAGRISVLCNYGVLTTGFDAPCVQAVVIARPTASPILYEQMIGRGMRGPRFGGTEECLVIDVEDNIRFGGQMAYARYDEYWTASAGPATSANARNQR